MVEKWLLQCICNVLQISNFFSNLQKCFQDTNFTSNTNKAFLSSILSTLWNLLFLLWKTSAESSWTKLLFQILIFDPFNILPWMLFNKFVNFHLFYEINFDEKLLGKVSKVELDKRDKFYKVVLSKSNLIKAHFREFNSFFGTVNIPDCHNNLPILSYKQTALKK